MQQIYTKSVLKVLPRLFLGVVIFSYETSPGVPSVLPGFFFSRSKENTLPTDPNRAGRKDFTRCRLAQLPSDLKNDAPAMAVSTVSMGESSQCRPKRSRR
jgi:hypothetical protein